MKPFVTPNLADLVRIVASAQADIVIVGGVAMTMRGADYVTYDIDICYRREPETIAKLCRALGPVCADLRAAFLDYQTALLTEDVPLQTDHGRVDLMGAIKGIGKYAQVAQTASSLIVDGFEVRVLSLDGLIAAKEAVLRDKDKLHLATLKALRALREERAPYNTGQTD